MQAALLAISLFASTGAPADVAIVGATVIDVAHAGRSAQDVSDATIVVRNGLITHVGRRQEVALPPGVTVIDAAGAFVVPGLIDGYGSLRTQGFADAYLYEGVTTVRVKLGPAGSDSEQTVATTQGGPRLIVDTGTGTGSPQGPAWVRNDHYLTALATPQELAAYAREPAGPAARAAYRAVCQTEPDSPLVEALGRRLLDAQAALMPVLSIEATADDVGAPNPWLGRSAVFVRPQELDDPVDPVTGTRPFLDSHRERREALRACARRRQEVDRKLHGMGVPYLAGSGAPAYGVMPGGGLHQELRLLQYIGLTPREALAAATGNLAERYGWTDIGLVAVGRAGDLLVLGSDPRLDVAAVDDIRAVIQRGHLVDRNLLLSRAIAHNRSLHDEK